MGLGFLSFVVLTFVGETVGLFAAIVTSAVYFFVCQFLLSRGNIDAYRKGWAVMLALDATVLISVTIMVLFEKWDVVLSQGPGLLAATCGGTYAGAVAASLAARRATLRH